MSHALGRRCPVTPDRPGQDADNDVAVALNTAFMGDGVVIHVAHGAAIEQPIHLVMPTGDKPRRDCSPARWS